MFEPSNMLKKYLSAEPRDMYDIVGALMGYINADPCFKTNDFDEAIRYVIKEGGVSKEALYQAFDPELNYQEDETKWDKEYYLHARVYLKDNFCEKRIAHVKAVAHKLYPAGNSAVNQQQTKTQGDPQTEKKGRSHQKKQRIPWWEKPEFVIPASLVALVTLVALISIIAGILKRKNLPEETNQTTNPVVMIVYQSHET